MANNIIYKLKVNNAFIVLFFFLFSVKERTSVSTGLIGCIRLLDVNNMVYNLQENGGNVLYGTAVGECGNNPCLPDPCKNGGFCQVKGAEMFHCKCVNGFSGESSSAFPYFFFLSLSCLPSALP